MSHACSKISSKSKTVIPREVRDRLELTPGDHLRHAVTENGVVIEKAGQPEDDPFAVFNEWSSAADEKAFGKL